MFTTAEIEATRLKLLFPDTITDVNPATAALEKDWRVWLPTVGPKTFTRAFSWFHEELWDWYWRVVSKQLAGESLNDDDSLSFLAMWARGFGKSSSVEWCAIAEGALFGKGYVLYVCRTEALAKKHVEAIRERLESDEISRYYPGLSAPKVGRHGNQYGWSQDYLSTDSGWAIRPVGLDVGVRGGKDVDQRLTMIIFDDIDEFGQSPALVKKNLGIISRSIIPAGAPGTKKLFAQNLIHRNSIINQIRTRRVHVLADRQESGPYKAFDDLEMELQQTDKGPKYFITAGTPTWKGIDLKECQQFLWDSGPEAFLAEYQHDFSAAEQGRVIKEYDEKLHVIRWSDFERVFGVKYIPSHWGCEIGLDVGFSKTHLSVATWVATAAMNSKLPGARFRYRGISWVEPLVDEIAEAIVEAMLPNKALGKKHNERFQVRRWVMSAEAKSERKTCQQKHRLPFLACDDDKQAGISQWRHYLRPDRRQPHPFLPDKQIEAEITIDGKRVKGTFWELGCPAWFDVVDDDQFIAPRDDKGLALHRQETLDWEWKPTPLTDTGMVDEAPVKAGDDSTDSTRMITAGWGPAATPLTDKEEIEAAMPEELQLETVKSATLTSEERAAIWLGRQEFIEDYQREHDPGDDRDKEWERDRNS